MGSCYRNSTLVRICRLSASCAGGGNNAAPPPASVYMLKGPLHAEILVALAQQQ